MEDRARRVPEDSKQKRGPTGGAIKDFNYRGGRRMTRTKEKRERRKRKEGNSLHEKDNGKS